MSNPTTKTLEPSVGRAAAGSAAEAEPWREGQTIWVDQDLRCPRCGSSINTNGDKVWCSYTKCTYGLGSLDKQGRGYVTWKECLDEQEAAERWR